MSEGLKQSYFRKNLTGLQTINADTITAANINIPNGLLNTSTIKCNYMNVCFIEYPDNGICTNLSANTALINQIVSIVPYINSSITSLNTSIVNALSSYNMSLSLYSIDRCLAYNSSMITYVSGYNTSLSAYSIDRCSAYNSSMMTYVS